jgi:ribosomal protein L11 methyltransferase
LSGDAARDWPYVELEAREEDADAIGSALLDAGSNGVEQHDERDGRVRLVAWFAVTPAFDAIAAAVASAPGVEPEAARLAVETLRSGATPDDDWLRLWKRGFEPVAIGSRLVVFPSWKRDMLEPYMDRVAVEIDPGMAFGTGTHETTRLCLEWLDASWTGGSLLDVGTGSGILAIAAALLATEATIVGVDVDPVAVDVARENAALNDVAERIAFQTGGPDSLEERFDVVLANLTADVVSQLAPRLSARVASGGTLVVSGVLAEQADDVARDLEAVGLERLSRRDAGEWVALELKRR